MKIVQITENEIFAYHDYEFMVFFRAALIGNSEVIGVCWPVGKHGRSNALDVVPRTMRRGGMKNSVLIMALLDGYGCDKYRI